MRDSNCHVPGSVSESGAPPVGVAIGLADVIGRRPTAKEAAEITSGTTASQAAIDLEVLYVRLSDRAASPANNSADQSSSARFSSCTAPDSLPELEPVARPCEFAATAHQQLRRSYAMTDKHTGTCFRGSVSIEVTGTPEAMGYCHCNSCRSWSAGPVNAFTLWKPGNVKVTKGAEYLGKFKKTDSSDRQFCQKVRRPSPHRPSGPRPDRRLRRHNPDRRLHARHPRELRRNGASHEGWVAEAEGLSGGIRRFW